MTTFARTRTRRQGARCVLFFLIGRVGRRGAFYVGHRALSRRRRTLGGIEEREAHDGTVRFFLNPYDARVSPRLFADHYRQHLTELDLVLDDEADASAAHVERPAIHRLGLARALNVD